MSIINKPKRGRKSKKELMATLNIGYLPVNDTQPEKKDDNNIMLNISDNNMTNEQEQDQDTTIFCEQNTESIQKQPGKKRGRKPKGGKIIPNALLIQPIQTSKPNIILHLKCSTKDLQKPSESFNSIENYNLFSSNSLQYNILNDTDNIDNIDTFTINENDQSTISSNKNICHNITMTSDDTNINCTYNNNMKSSTPDEIPTNTSNVISKDIWQKIKQLEYDLHFNNINNKKSCCFWDTCEFDNPPIRLPKHFINNSYNVYGCFCSPECAIAYLMNEHINNSTKFERYQLFYHIYSKYYNYNTTIKPAPNPYYILDKYYGNLSIQEYRQLLKSDRVFLIIDKPLTKITPEIIEENDEYLLSTKNNNNNNNTNNNSITMIKSKYKLNKNSIISTQFGGNLM